MVVGVLQFELLIHGASCLKDKRRVVRSLRDRIVRAHRVSVSEVANQDILNRATLAVACVGTDGRVLGRVLDKVLDIVRASTDADIVDSRRDFIGGIDIEENLPERDDRPAADLTDEEKHDIEDELLADFATNQTNTPPMEDNTSA